MTSQLQAINAAIQLLEDGNVEAALSVLRNAINLAVSPPEEIPTGMSVDATAGLVEWVKTLAPGTVADFGSTKGKVYRIDRPLTLDGLTGLTIRNANLIVGAPTPVGDHRGTAQTAIGLIRGSARRHVWLRDCADIKIENLSVSGQNVTDDNGRPIPEDGQAFYHSLMEFEHALHVERCTNVHIDGLRADAIFGDGFYFRGSSDCSIRNFRVSRNGRQGGAVISGSRIKILHGEMVHSRRSGIDLEPNFATERMEDIELGHLRLRTRLLPVTAGGSGTVDGLHIHDIESFGSSVPVLNLTSPHGGRRDNVLVERWKSDGSLGSATSPVRASNINNLTVRDVTMRCSTGRNMTGVALTNAGKVTLERVTFPGAAKLVMVDHPAANYDLTTIDCAPTA